MEYKVELTQLALQMLAAIKDRRQQRGLLERAQKLRQDPEKQGKPLTGNLRGYFSVRALGQRYRIVYQVDQEQVVVVVIGLGRRKAGDKADVYTVLRKLLDN